MQKSVTSKEHPRRKEIAMIDEEGKPPSEKSSKTPPKSQETKMPYKRIQTAEGWQRSVTRRRKRDEA